MKSLQIAWTWDSPDERCVGAATTRERPGDFKATPLMIDGVLYTSTAFNQVAAIDAATGKTLWNFDPQAYASGRRPANSGWQHRGVAYWSGKVESSHEARVVIATGIGELIALDARTGVTGRILRQRRACRSAGGSSSATEEDRRSDRLQRTADDRR